MGTVRFGLTLLAVLWASSSVAQVAANPAAVTPPDATCTAEPAGTNPAQGGEAVAALHRWLAAFNGADRENYRKYLEEEFPSGADRFKNDEGLKDNTGGFDIQKIEENTPTRVAALLQERVGDEFAHIVLDIDPNNPCHIQKIDLVPVPRPADFSQPHLNSKELIAELRQRLDQAAKGGRFSGAVLVARDGKPLFAQAYGFADREHGIANTLQTRFALASMGKMFTGVAVLQLVEGGRVNLDGRLIQYLPDYPNKDLAEKVTIRELLTNTGGTGDIWGPAFTEHREELRTLAGFVKVYGNRPLAFEPGSRWEYSNYGFVLLARVVEVVSGQSYDDYLQEHIFAPADMRFTAPEGECQADTACSVRYTRGGGGVWHRADDSSAAETTASGGYATIGDLLKFSNALNGNKLLSARYTRELTMPRVKNPIGFDAYGFGVQKFNGTECFGHNGASIGINGDLEICPGPGYIVISLANLDPPAAQQISEVILDRLPADRPPAAQGKSK